MSLAEAAAWTWHAGADNDETKIAAKAAARRRMSAVVAAAPLPPRSASTSHAAAGRGSLFGDVVLQASLLLPILTA